MQTRQSYAPARPLQQTTILDYIHSEEFTTLILSALDTDPNFLGGSPQHYDPLLQALKQEKAEKTTTASSSSNVGGATDDGYDADDNMTTDPAPVVPST
jgi:hypothetical protein